MEPIIPLYRIANPNAQPGGINAGTHGLDFRSKGGPFVTGMVTRLKMLAARGGFKYREVADSSPMTYIPQIDNYAPNIVSDDSVLVWGN